MPLVKRPMPEKPLPKVGERFQQLQLPINARAAFKRLSQIYGIPLQELVPRYGGKPKYFISRGEYSRSKHEIYLRNDERFAKRHEFWHALQWLLLPRKRFKKKEKGIKGAIKRIAKKINEIRLEHLFLEPSANVDLPFSESDFRSFIKTPLFQNFFQKYGTDGMLLLFARPPRKFDRKSIENYGNMLVKEGYLKNGKLTKKGIQLLKRYVPAELLIKRAHGLKS